MRDVILIYKKEAKDFSVRKAMLRRYAVLLAVNIIMAVYSNLGAPVPVMSFCLMLFTTFVVLGFLAVDVIGSEKEQKTYETLLSTPLPLSKLFYGMTAFMATIGVIFVLIATVYNNIWLTLLFHQSYLSLTDGLPRLLAVYAVVILSVLFMILIGLVITLFMKNLKAGRFLTLLVGFALIFGIYEFITHYRVELSVLVIVGLLVLLGLVFMSIQRHMNKQYALRFAR